MKITIPITPKAQSRPKATVRGRHAGVYELPQMVAWRELATKLVKIHYHGPFYSLPIKVDVTFYMPAPKKISDKPTPRAKEKRKKLYDDFINERVYVATKPDLDNLEKAIYDSISNSGMVWKDDNLIVEHTTRKLYSPNPRIEVEIERL